MEYKGYKILADGTVLLKETRINKYDCVLSAQFAIDNDDIKTSIGNLIATELKKNFDCITKMDAIKFIKNTTPVFSLKDIVTGWNYAYNS
ncbi:MAG: hypothetical protein ACPGXZ_06035 [Saprospiraceae bacterium]